MTSVPPEKAGTIRSQFRKIGLLSCHAPLCRSDGAQSDYGTCDQEEGVPAAHPNSEEDPAIGSEWSGRGGDGPNRVWKDSSLCYTHA